MIIQFPRYFTDDELGDVLDKPVRCIQPHTQEHSEKLIEIDTIGRVMFDINGDPDDLQDKDFQVVIDWEKGGMRGYRRDEFDIFCEVISEKKGG